MAGIEAVRAWREVTGELPVNIKFMVEGDDEVETGHLGEFVTTHRVFAQGGCGAPAGCRVHAGWQQRDPFGTAGSLAVELSVTTGSKEPYFIWTQLFRTLAFRLVWALASLKDQNEHVLIERFYDNVQPPTAEEQALMDDYPGRTKGTMRSGASKSLLRERKARKRFAVYSTNRPAPFMGSNPDWTAPTPAVSFPITRGRG